MPTFGRGLGAVGGDLPHAGAVAAERHQAGDDGRLAEADVAHDGHAAVGAGVGAVEVGVDLLEEPLAAREDGVHGDAGHLKQQRFEGDVLRPIGGKTHWWVRKMENWLVVKHTRTTASLHPAHILYLQRIHSKLFHFGVFLVFRLKE